MGHSQSFYNRDLDTAASLSLKWGRSKHGKPMVNADGTLFDGDAAAQATSHLANSS